MPDPQSRSPADRILDRHCPLLCSAERDLATERLHNLARVLVGIARRHTLEINSGDSTHPAASGRIPSLPDKL